MLVAAGIQNHDLVGHQHRGERDILGDDEIAWLRVLCDILIRHIWPTIDAYGRHERVSGRRLESLVGDEHSFDSQPLGRTKDQFLHVPRGSVCIDPNLQVRAFEMVGLVSRIRRTLRFQASGKVLRPGAQ